MNPSPGKFNRCFLVGTALLVLGSGCYNPKPDIESFRPQAEKYFAALQQVGKDVTAQPPLTADTLNFPDPKTLRFTDGPGGRQNAVIIAIDSLTEPGSNNPRSAVTDNNYYLPAWTLLHDGTDPHIDKLTKEIVPWRFQQLLDIQYLVVLRIKYVYAEVKSAGEFAGGQVTGEAFLYDLGDAPKSYGGFAFAARSSQEVSLTVHGDAAQQEIDRSLAVRKDIDDQAEKLIHQKLKASLPGAAVPSSW